MHEDLKVWQETNGARNVPRQAVLCKVQVDELGRAVKQALRHRPAQLVPTKIKIHDGLQIVQLVWDFSGEVVGVKVEDSKLGEVAERRRDRARKIVAGKVEGREARQLPERGRNGPRELGVAEVEGGEEGQVAELGCHDAGQRDAGER